MKPTLLLLALLPGAILAADLPPDKGNELPASAQRPVVVTGKPSIDVPKADLPEGYTLSVAAAAPLVLHPIMGCLDDKGRLFIGDGVGVNWNKAQLEANPPNRVLMLEDTDNDGAFDKSTVFADKMTFPQGAAWLDGSLYVCSPPGLWKLTDTNNDGVADQREMIVSGFEYTGNAADVHGPFLHPNGRLYWCHGRKGHKATDRDGKVVHEGLACGIWSCKPDGRDLQWHALGCGDNPVEVDFTPDGDIIGVQNLYYTNPRGDTLVHWLFGGVYERSDQLKAIEGLPRTLEHMPVMYNFGHVAVSGSCFWKSYERSADTPVRNEGPQDKSKSGEMRADKSVRAPVGAPLQFMVTHFNTQRVVRMELTPDGSTYKATENEFLKLHSPDIHFTDVMEDPRDGSLLVVDTGGWFRIGCPSSLMAKPDIAGAIYRVKKVHGLAKTPGRDKRSYLGHSIHLHEALQSKDPILRRRAIEMAVGSEGVVSDTKTEFEVLEMLGDKSLDPSLEHALMNAARRNQMVDAKATAAAEKDSLLRRRLLGVLATTNPDEALNLALEDVQSHNAKSSAAALTIVLKHPDADARLAPMLLKSIQSKRSIDWQTAALTGALETLLAKPETQKLVAVMLEHENYAFKNIALNAIGNQAGAVSSPLWLPALETLVSRLPASQYWLVLDAIKKVKHPGFDVKLQALANDTKLPQPIRLKALDAMSTRKITGETFTMVLDVLTKPESSAAAKIQAADMMAHSGHTSDEMKQLAKAFATVGPIELKSLLALIKPCKEEDILRAMATELARNPALISQQESIYRTALADKPTDIFEKIIHPAYAKAYDAIDAKKRTLGPLADKVIASGDAKAGQAVYELGKGTCIACHQIGDKGRTIGPNLSHIGGIRTERDILESILFPSNTLARDYEAHIIETNAGETIMGVIKSHTAEGLLVVDVAGQEKNIPQTQMVSDTTLNTSLMPMGLDATLPEEDLVDLVAYLRSLK
ncbi:MAG: c-type cytochrome [Verrucomicrobiaceae bacterium]|nr:c-type cytochrome [Verrucomicrobiaceae bacterium]